MLERRRIALILAVLLSGIHSGMTADWFVALSGSGADGTTWATAYTNVQQAIDAAGPDDTIYLKGETFVLPTNQPVGKLYWGPDKPGLAIFGGYQGVGPEPGPAASTPTVWLNTLTPWANSNRILYVAGVTNGTLRNITIQGGTIGYPNPQTIIPTNIMGGGIYMTGCVNMVLSGVILHGNSLYAQQGSAAFGAGLFALNSSGLISNCVFRANWLQRFYSTAAYGGGMHLAGGEWTVRDSQIRDNVTANQTSYGDTCRGLGVYVGSGQHRLENCAVTRNFGPSLSPPQGEGLYVNAGTVDVYNCTFYWQHFSGIQRGGGVVRVRDSILWSNGDDVAGAGVSLENCLIEDGDSNGVAGCTALNPLFERGLYLATNSPGVNAGGRTAEAAGLGARTTRADGTADADAVDLGYHFAGGVQDYYVSVNEGSDSNTGVAPGAGNAFRSIAKALSLAGHGTHVHVEAGHYTTNTETYPLQAPYLFGLQILGTNATLTRLAPFNSLKRAIGLIYNYPDARVTGLSVTGAYFSAEYAYGAGIYSDHAQVVIEDCAFVSNRCFTTSGMGSSWGNMGGVGIFTANSEGEVTRCVIRDNRATTTYTHSSGLSGGVRLHGNWLMRECEITGNEVVSPAGWGDWVASGGGVHMTGTNVLRNCLVARNSAKRSDNNKAYEYGDGVFVSFGVALLENCTISTNMGEGLRRGAGTVTVSNSILWANGLDATGILTLAWCDAGIVSTNVMTNSCISADPVFANAATGDFHLVRSSPAANAGRNEGWMTAATDLDGNARLRGRKVDLGAYEAEYRAGSLMVVR